MSTYRRPDDFSVAMAIGDSITAGAFAKGKLMTVKLEHKFTLRTCPGIDPNDKLMNWVEWRGVSYAGGGDDGAITMPNVQGFHPQAQLFANA